MKSRLAIGGVICLMACLVLVPTLLRKQGLRPIEMTIEVPGARLVGTLHLPARSGDHVPVVVLLHGSGPDGRTNSYYHELAGQFARVGYATFVYDKRGSGASSGSLLEVPFQTIIDDAVTVVEQVRKRPETDDNRIVIWGGSEGGSTAPEVAVRSKASAVITQSASGVPFWKQNRHQNLLAMQRAGLSRSQVDMELAAHAAAMHYARTGEGWVEFERLRNSGITLPIRNSRNDLWWKWYGTKLDYEPTRWLERLQVPVLSLWGRQDVLVPVDESIKQFRKALSMNRNTTMKVMSAADHGMSNGNGLVHLDLMSAWLEALP